MKRKKIYIPVIIILLIFQCWCKKVPFYAGEGATLTISADRTQLKTGGDRTRLTVMGFNDEGQPLHDHTSVVFSATLGTVSPATVELMAGSAAVEFISGDRSGVAEITARSGNIKAEPDPLQITIGSAALESLSLSANPSQFDPGGGRSQIRVYAFDADGNLLEGIALVLSTTSGYFEHAAPVYTTNAEGMVEDFLHLTETATVKAESGEINAEVEITVDTETENQLPQPDFSISPSSPVRGETVYFNGSLSSDPDGSIVSWQWDFGDGQMGSGERVTHSFTWDGNTNRTFTVLLKVTDNRKGVSVTSKSITIETEEENQPPVANFTFSPSSPQKKERVYFNGSLSSDPDGSIVSWQWDFGDGRKGEGETIRHFYNWSNDEDRTFTVTLTVIDDAGAEGVTTKTITVRGLAALAANDAFP
ncbi:MAG: hypothetical protein QG657_1432 [Acidobacteriota bacterium]|nr:hypothetical protein [Acidobacteriota bacterium]